MAKYYAWSNFNVEFNDFGQPTKTIKCGDEITASALEVSKEDFEELVTLGAVREEKYPNIPDTMAPADAKAQAAAIEIQELELGAAQAQVVEVVETAKDK